MTFNILDIIFIIIMLLLAFHGSVAGFIKEFFSKIAIVVGIFVAVVFYDQLSPFLLDYIKSDFITKILSFLMIFILGYLIVRVIQHFVGNIFDGEILAGLDKVLGFFLGAIEGLLIVCVILILFYAQPWIPMDSLLNSSTFHSGLHEFLAKPVGVVQGFIV